MARGESSAIHDTYESLQHIGDAASKEYTAKQFAILRHQFEFVMGKLGCDPRGAPITRQLWMVIGIFPGKVWDCVLYMP